MMTETTRVVPRVFFLVGLLVAFPCCYSTLHSIVYCITPTRVEATQKHVDTYSNGNCNVSNFTLQHVLHNYKEFFKSNTKLQLLPGTHEVSESVGSIVLTDIYNFEVIGATCNPGNGTLLQTCSRIECNQGSNLGIVVNASINVTISDIHIVNCSTNSRKLFNSFTLFNNNNRGDAVQLCYQYTFLAIRSSHITVNRMTLENWNGACLIAIGVYRYQLQHSLIKARCVVMTLDQGVFSGIHQFHGQSYTLTNLSKLNFDIRIEFHHYTDSVQIDISNVIIKYGDLIFQHYNHYEHKSYEYCSNYFNTTTSISTTTKIRNLTIIGACYGLVLHSGGFFPCYNEAVKHNSFKYNLIFFLDKGQFIQSNIQMYMGSGKLHTSYHIVILRINMKQVPCSCGYAMFIAYAEVTVRSFTITKSCCRRGALVYLLSAKVTFYGLSQFLQNKHTCISSINGSIMFKGHTLLSNNRAETNSRSTIFMANSFVEVGLNSLTKLQFINNTGKSCGGIMATKESIITIKSSATFINNRGYNGGALALYDYSILKYEYRSSIKFIGNVALHTGGAIYIADVGYQAEYETRQPFIYCAFKPPIFSTYSLDVTQVNSSIAFKNNTAQFAGGALYGGWIDICEPDTKLSGLYTINNYSMIFIKIVGDLSQVASNPSRVCICFHSTPQCNITEHVVDPQYPGQSFQIEAVAVGQRFGTTPSIISAAFVNNSIKVEDLQQLQNTEKFCTRLNYTVKSPNQEEQLRLTVDRKYIPEIPGPNSHITQQVKLDINLLLTHLSLTIPLLQCPLGYTFDHNTSYCICNQQLKQQEVNCDTTTYSVLRTTNQWINVTFEHINNTRALSHGVLVHSHCPFDYCTSKDQSLKLESPSDQCNFNRSGILCGACRGNLSQIFGTNNCKECSSVWALLVIPVITLLGLSLVAVIIILNLTVAQGTVDALIFYANIVSANQAIFFSTETTNTFFRWFIAWLNLDAGIETCFISGLDAYTKTWLQFLFPIYIWVLVIVIIMASRYSTLAARLSGENAVPALATLFLLSYTKLLRIIITTFSSTQLEYPDGYMRRVWLYDGNVDFFEPKHTVLFVASLLLLLIISVPYTLVLFTIQWLQRLPYHCLLFWVWKLKPLFDAHTGPYKEKHRYWPGLLLLVRAVLFVAFSMNVKMIQL